MWGGREITKTNDCLSDSLWLHPALHKIFNCIVMHLLYVSHTLDRQNKKAKQHRPWGGVTDETSIYQSPAPCPAPFTLT